MHFHAVFSCSFGALRVGFKSDDPATEFVLKCFCEFAGPTTNVKNTRTLRNEVSDNGVALQIVPVEGGITQGLDITRSGKTTSAIVGQEGTLSCHAIC